MKTLLLKILAVAALSIGAMVVPLATALFAVGKDDGGRPLVNIKQYFPVSRKEMCVELIEKHRLEDWSISDYLIAHSMDYNAILSEYYHNRDVSHCGFFRNDDDRNQRWAWGYKQYRYGEYPDIEISTFSRTRDNSRIILPKDF
jgi:hypothetical protein